MAFCFLHTLITVVRLVDFRTGNTILDCRIPEICRRRGPDGRLRRNDLGLRRSGQCQQGNGGGQDLFCVHHV
jgi:hypothetical protein